MKFAPESFASIRKGKRRLRGAGPEVSDAEATTATSSSAPGSMSCDSRTHEPVLYGYDLAAALGFARGFQNVSAGLVSISDSDAARPVERLRETLVAHQSDAQGVTLDSRAWLITARRR
jgi:hypothetical protein